MKNTFIKGPFNYSGNKYRLLPQLSPYLPEYSDKFVDLFSGGANIGINVNADLIICNDINVKINEFYRYLKSHDIENILNEIDRIIIQYNQSRTKSSGDLEVNQAGFLKLRNDYNHDPNPLMLYVLIAYSFNYQCRFNNSMKYNSSFSKNCCVFTDNMKQHLIDFTNALTEKNIVFTDNHFTELKLNRLTNDSFVYADPPYLITTGSYNDGKRGFGDWKLEQEHDLYKLLDGLNDKGIKFALSNVLEHKDKVNTELYDWAKDKYYINDLDYQYGKTYSTTKKRTSREVLITNYQKEDLKQQKEIA